MLTTADNVRLAGPEDAQAVSYMVLRMLDERGQEPGVPSEELADRIREDGPDENGYFNCFIAFHRMRPSGLLIFTQAYDMLSFRPSGLVQDVFVSDAARGNGLSDALMLAMGRYALQHRWNRIDWLTNRMDKDAIAFFQKSVGNNCTHISFRLEGRALEQWVRARR